jgi:hypothetical protein
LKYTLCSTGLEPLLVHCAELEEFPPYSTPSRSCFKFISPYTSSFGSAPKSLPLSHAMASQPRNGNTNLKHRKFGHLPLSTSGPQDCALRGTALLITPYLNKGAAFTAEERKEFNLTGLLPQNVQTLDQQVKRAYQQYCTRQDPLAKNTFMTSLSIQNQVLYYRVSVMF